MGHMAKNPKVKDPTEDALSAIQEALNISDLPAAESDVSVRSEPSLRGASRGADLRQGADDLLVVAAQVQLAGIDAGVQPRDLVGQ